MSHLIQNACRKLQMPPTAKAVLMALASYADDAGVCWPAILALAEWTCYSERAVRSAIRDLEKMGYVTTQASFGRASNRYTIHPNPAAGAGYATRQLTTPTRQLTTPTRQLTTPTRQELPPNHQELPRTISKANTKKGRASAPIASVDRPDDVTEQTWTDWLALRRAKRAPVTPTVLASALAESAKASMPLEQFLSIWCSRGSQGLQADWLRPHERVGRGPPCQPAPPSASANFRGKTYVGTPIDDLPPDLREAARAALAGG